MNGQRAYSVRLEGAKYGASFSSALAIATRSCGRSSTDLSWLYVIYYFDLWRGEYSAPIRSHWALRLRPILPATKTVGQA